jgi:hypothetical protein
MSIIRLDYRDSKIPKAVYVYTIAQESRYIIIENIPSLGVIDQLIDKCRSYGSIQEHRMLDDHASSTEYVDVVWIQYHDILSARMAKRKMDDKPFFTNLLRVNYAPEYETFDDIRAKFQDRLEAVSQKLAKSQRTFKKRKDIETEDAIIGPQRKPEQQQPSVPSVKKRKRI